MKIIVGLGNPGKEYESTRHNCGFMFVDALAKELEKSGIEIEWKKEKKLKAEIAKFNYKNEAIVVAKPMTFMNLSGESVRKILNFYKETPQNLSVIYDDIDLPLKEVRIREKGSAGSHNGMKSIINEIGSQEFKRIRIGIESRGDSSPERQSLESFVLSNFSDEEKTILDETLKESIKEFQNSLDH
jgi:PTH1 family peptidyl-tRNA hydrolase